MIEIEKLLAESSSPDGWKVCREAVESYQLFFVHKKLETVRSTDTETVNVTVYKNHDGKKGMASFKLYASTTEDEARARIEDAANKALLIFNEDYTLPENETLSGEIESNFADDQPMTLAARMAEAVFAADMLGMGTINALEIFIDKHRVTVRNSCGIDKQEIKYTSMIEAIPTWNQGESVELYQSITAGSFDFDKIKTAVETKMREVRDRGCAKAPEDKLSCPVLLQPQEMSELFWTLASDLDYAAVYMHLNPYSVGDDIQKSRTGDGVTVTMRGSIPGCTASALFDGDGTSLTDARILEEGKVIGSYGSHRFAQYLKQPATGSLGCLELAAGTLTDRELNAAPYFECVSMSGLQVDVFNDYIGGEVRLAYYFDGKEKHPVTGISISGKLSEALASIRLSDTCTLEGSYYGPAFGLLKGIEIV